MTAPCPDCGHQSWNALINPGEPCLPCKRKYAPSGSGYYAPASDFRGDCGR